MWSSQPSLQRYKMVLTSEVDALLDVPLARWPPPVSLERNKTLSGLFSGSIESNDDELVF